jgi:GAF domain-containing protein
MAAPISHRHVELLTLLESLHSSSAAIPDVQALDEALESILSELTEKLNFEFAAISLVDEYRDCIETVRGRNISPGWIMRARHGLNERDIQTHVVNTGEMTDVICGWHDLLDKEIYERFEHWRLARAWAPIISADHRVVGTIEAGCNKERKDEVFTEAAIERIKQLGSEMGEEIATKRPHILLQGIAKDAIRLIGADSAALHVYRRSPTGSLEGGGDENRELILAAGAGKATPNFVQSYAPRKRGRGTKAMRTGMPDKVNPSQFKAAYPKLYEMGVRALAVIPLKLGRDAEGILGIHSWRSEKQFTSRELNLAEMFARHMEGVIQNYLLLTRATEAGSRAWALSGLQTLMQSLTSPFSLPDVLQKIGRNALLTLDADNVAVYQYHADRNHFHVPPVLDGQFLDAASMKTELSPDDTPFQFVKRGQSQFIADVHKHKEPDLAGARADDQPRFIQRERVQSCAVLILRSAEAGEIVGLLFVNFRQSHNFTGEEKKAMYALATSAALAIRNARLHKDDLKSQLEAMHEVHAAIAEKGPDLTQVLERLLQLMLKLTGAKYGVCMRYDEHSQLLEPIARWPPREDYPIEPQALGEGIVGLAAKSKKSILVEDVDDQNKSMFIETVGDFFPAKIYKKVNLDARCEIAVPLLDEGRLLGVLNVEHPAPRALTQDERVLLQTLAVPAIIAFHTVYLYKRLERRIRHAKALNLVAARVQEKPYELDTILRLFLTGITAGDGLGFSRAMVFLADQDSVLRGRAAIGPLTEEQAKEVWESFEYGQASVTRDFDALLRQAAQFSDGINEGKLCEYSPLSSVIQRLSLPIDSGEGALAESMIKAETVTVKYGQIDPFRGKIWRLAKLDNVLYPFASVPLVGKHMPQIGALVVDNRFLWKERKIDPEDIEGLEAFARQLALSIENVYLRQKLTEEQKLESWREATASIAHSMGTLLFEVQGDVKDVATRLCTCHENVWRDVEPMFHELYHGITMAERVLWDFRTFAAPTRLDLERVDFRQIVKDVFEGVMSDCHVEMSLPKAVLPVFADSFKLSNAIREIRQNAQEAMAAVCDKPRVITVTAYATRATATSQAYAQLEITDCGPGFTDKVKLRLFQPYFTTKLKGTGLGLATASKVISAHGGMVEANNSPDGGARFVVRIPILGKSRNVAQGASNA